MCTMRAMSTLETQAGCISLIEGVKETILMKWMINELEISQECVKIHSYSQSVNHFTWLIMIEQNILTFTLTLIET